MLLKELDHLNQAIEQLNGSLESIYKIIDSILSDPAKNYDLTFKKKSFFLSPPFTKEDLKRVKNDRRKYISLILNHVIKKRVNHLVGDKDYFPKELFEILYAFAYGEDPKDHQLDLIKLKEVYEVGDKEHGKERPLNKESYQVHLQDVKKVKEQDFIKEI